MKIFIISQVRLADKDEMIRQKIHVEFYEQLGHEVYWPNRDTDQVDHTGLSICEAIFRGMQKADVIHVLWHPSSEGTKFDLGMAFALGKPIVPFGVTLQSHGKSFPAMIQHYFDKYGLSGAQLPRLAEILRTSYGKVEVLSDKEMDIIANKEQQETERKRTPIDIVAHEIFKYLGVHGVRANIQVEKPTPEEDRLPELIILTDLRVSAGEQETIVDMAKGYTVTFKTAPEQENGA